MKTQRLKTRAAQEGNDLKHNIHLGLSLLFFKARKGVNYSWPYHQETTESHNHI